MQDENITIEQLMDELAGLRQENIELKFALKGQEQSSAESAWSSPSPWFLTGKPEQQQKANNAIKYKFSELVDMSFVQQLLNSFYEATGISHSLLDNENNILSRAGWQEICTQFHRVCPQTECRCQESDSYIAAHLHEGPYIGYKCMNGLIDYAAPIIIEGQHLATIFKGQVMHEPPDEDFFRRQAQKYGFNEAAYIEALRQVPIIPEKQLESIMKFYSQLGQILVNIGLERKRQLEAADKTIKDQQERLDRLNLVGEMAASIGHEIRNPMTTVRGYLQIMRENENYAPEIEYFDLMIEELDRANSIITEYLSLAKNKMVDMAPCNLNSIISKSLPLLQAQAVGRDQSIKAEMKDLPDLQLDQKEIRQLVLNLVNNAMESMSASGNVTIRTSAAEDEVVLAIQDQGHGIDRETLDKLGTPFFTTKDQGTGLGLAVCYGIAARHQARIDIETDSDGTTFYVRFPIQTAAAVG